MQSKIKLGQKLLLLSLLACIFNVSYACNIGDVCNCDTGSNGYDNGRCEGVTDTSITPNPVINTCVGVKPVPSTGTGGCSYTPPTTI